MEELYSSDIMTVKVDDEMCRYEKLIILLLLLNI